MSEAKSIGAIFREERESREIGTSKAAAETRIKVQLIEAMENDDFSGMAAAAYAKGFIKLYAEYLELDPTPLIEEYKREHATEKRSSLTGQDSSRESGETMREAGQKLASILKGIPREKWMQAGAVVAGLLMAVVIATAVSHLGRSCDQQAAQKAQEAAKKHEILQEPPDPYL